MAKTIDYEFTRGDTKVLKKFKPVDLEGNVLVLEDSDQIYFTMKNANKSVVVQKTIGHGITYGEDGYYHITLKASDTEELAVGTYNYDIELDLHLENTFVSTLIDGEITLNEDITTKGDK